MTTVSDAAALSSGTIATLTGEIRYAQIDRIQAGFVDFVAAALEAGHHYASWRDAWEDYDER